MWRALKHLESRDAEFTVRLDPDMSYDDMVLFLVRNPDALCDVTHLTIASRQDSRGLSLQFGVGYGVPDPKRQVWRVSNPLELSTAVWSILSSRCSHACVAVDNRSRFMDAGTSPMDVTEYIRRYGADYEAFQSGQGVGVLTLFDGDLIMIDVHLDFFDTEEDMEGLMAGMASIALSPSNSGSVEERIVYIQNAISSGTRYLCTGRDSDHSAVSLVSSGEGVCQAIAALTHLFLRISGIPSRVICGDAYSDDFGWGPHAWCLVRMDDGRWLHLDNTATLGFTATDASQVLMDDAEASKIRTWNHSWYSAASNDATNARMMSMSHSVFAFCPEADVVAVNGAVVRMPGTEPPMVVDGGRLMFDAWALIRMVGGVCKLNSSHGLLEAWIPGTGTMVAAPCVVAGADHAYVDKAGLAALGFATRQRQDGIIVVGVM